MPSLGRVSHCFSLSTLTYHGNCKIKSNSNTDFSTDERSCLNCVGPYPQHVHWQCRFPAWCSASVPQPTLAGTICRDERRLQLQNLLPTLRVAGLLPPPGTSNTAYISLLNRQVSVRGNLYVHVLWGFSFSLHMVLNIIVIDKI